MLEGKPQPLLGLIWQLCSMSVLFATTDTIAVLHYDIHGHRHGKEVLVTEGGKESLLQWVNELVYICHQSFDLTLRSCQTHM